jgi:magnesium transporter
LRLRKTIPEATDKLFVTDRKNTLLGELPLTAVLLNDPETLVQTVMDSDPTSFQPDDKAEAAASAFERYDLISAPVVDAKGKLMGRLTIEEIVDVVNEESDSNLRRMGGLSPEEDVFAPVSKAVKNPLGMAGHQPVYRVYRLARHRSVRTHHFTTGGAGGVNADRRGDRRQYR